MSSSKIDTVQLDGLVLLKIINHCKEAMPDVVSGQLLGLDTGSTLEVTACYPLPSSLSSAAEDTYQLEMMKMLRTVNVDNNAVGWYQSAYLGSFFDSSLVDAQYQYQRAVRSSVVIVYDPSQTSRGRLTIRAFRLSDLLMSVYEKGAMYQHVFSDNDIESSGIWRELQVKVHNSHLVHGFLYELRESRQMQCEEVLSLGGSSAFISQHLLGCGSSVDEYTQEQSQFQYNQRNIARQKQAQLNFLNKMQQDAEIKQMQSQHSAQAAAAVASNPAASPTAVSAAASASSPQAHIDLQKDISTIISFINQNHNSHPVTIAALTAFTPLHNAAAVEQILKNPVFRGVGRQNRLNNYLLCNGMDQQIASIRAQAVHTLSKHFLIEAVHKEAPRSEDAGRK